MPVQPLVIYSVGQISLAPNEEPSHTETAVHATEKVWRHAAEVYVVPSCSTVTVIRPHFHPLVQFKHTSLCKQIALSLSSGATSCSALAVGPAIARPKALSRNPSPPMIVFEGILSVVGVCCKQSPQPQLPSKTLANIDTKKQYLPVPEPKPEVAPAFAPRTDRREQLDEDWTQGL